MIDYGATHNFIHRQLVEDLKLPVTNTTNYRIIIENNTTFQGKGVCKEVIVELPGVTVLKNFLPLDLGRLDIILGIDLVTYHGLHGSRLGNLTMTFTRVTSKVVLKGDASLTKAKVSMKMMISNWEEEDQGFLIEFHNLVLEPEEGRKMDLLKLQEEQVHSIIKRLIRKNEKVFQTPTRLPPQRGTDHQIVMKEG